MSEDGSSIESDNFLVKTTVEKDRGNYERIAPEDILASAERYKTFFNMPEGFLDRVREIKGFRVSNEQMVNEHIRRSHERIAKINELLSLTSSKVFIRREQLLEEKQALLAGLESNSDLGEIEETHGQFMITPEGERELFIQQGLGEREPDVLDHEVLHALSAASPNEQGLSHLSEGKFEYQMLDEAGTELLRIAEKHPDLEVMELYKKCRDGEFDDVYSDEVRALITILALAEVNKLPFSIQDLAEYYFGLGQGGMVSKGILPSLLPKLVGAYGDKESEKDAEQFMAMLK